MPDLRPDYRCLRCGGNGYELVDFGRTKLKCPDCKGYGQLPNEPDKIVEFDKTLKQLYISPTPTQPDSTTGRRIGGVPVTKAIERLDRLERRAEWLEDRAGASNKDLAFDKGEASALRWAVAVIAEILLP